MTEEQKEFIKKVSQDTELIKNQIKDWYDQNTDWRQMEIGYMLTDILSAYYGLRSLVRKIEQYNPV